MSNYFDIYCRTCSTAGDVFHCNGFGGEITRICCDLLTLKEIGLAFKRLTSNLELGWPHGGRENITVITPDLLEFAIAHAGHDVAARSEYGGFHDKCSRYWTCSNCTSSHACLKSPGHAELCGPVGR